MEITKTEKRYPGKVVVAYQDTGQTKRYVEEILGGTIKEGQWIKVGKGLMARISQYGVSTIKPFRHFFKARFESQVKAEAILSSCKIDYRMYIFATWVNEIPENTKSYLFPEAYITPKFLTVLTRTLNFNGKVLKLVIDDIDIPSTVWITPQGLFFNPYEIDEYTMESQALSILAWVYQNIVKKSREWQ